MRPLLVSWLAARLGRGAAELLAPTYFTFAAIAALVAGGLVIRRAGPERRAIARALAIGYAAALASGIAVPFVIDQITHGPILRWPGMLAYGGFAGGFLAAALVLRREKVPFARFADLAAAPLGLAIAFVRVGCFVAGCDYGKVTASALGVRFPEGSPAWIAQVNAGLVPPIRAASLPVHPTQLYEAALGIAIFFIVSRVQRHRLATALALYAVGRSAIEILRGDADRGLFGPFSTSQLISVLLLAGLAAVYLNRRVVVAAALVLFCGAARADGGQGWDASLDLGVTSPLNRPAGEVPQLFTGSFTATYSPMELVAVGFVGEAGENPVASHTTFDLYLATRHKIVPRLEALAWGGVGYLKIDFKDPTFADVAGNDWRFGANIGYAVSDRWMVQLTPFAFDFAFAPGIGGPIVSYQLKLGLVYTTRPVKPPPTRVDTPMTQPYSPAHQ